MISKTELDYVENTIAGLTLIGRHAKQELHDTDDLEAFQKELVYLMENYDLLGEERAQEALETEEMPVLAKEEHGCTVFWNFTRIDTGDRYPDDAPDSVFVLDLGSSIYDPNGMREELQQALKDAIYEWADEKHEERENPVKYRLNILKVLDVPDISDAIDLVQKLERFEATLPGGKITNLKGEPL